MCEAIQLLLIGDSYSGKSAFVFEYLSSECCPLPEYKASIGISKTPASFNELPFQFVELGGEPQSQEFFFNNQDLSIYSGCIIFIDLSKDNSTASLSNYLLRCKSMKRVVVGNKMDCISDENKEKISELEKQFQSQSIPFFALSVMYKDRIHLVVERIINLITMTESSQCSTINMKKVDNNNNNNTNNNNNANNDNNANNENKDQSAQSQCCLLI